MILDKDFFGVGGIYKKISFKQEKYGFIFRPTRK